MVAIYLFENIIQYKEKEEIKEFIMPKKAMEYGKIKNIPIFEEYLSKLIKQEKWVNLFQSKPIAILLPLFYEETDKEILTVILNNLGIKNIKYKKELSIYDKKNNQLILNVHTNYITVYYQQKCAGIKRFYPLNIYHNIDEAIKHIQKNYKNTTMYLLGSNSKLANLIKKIDSHRCFYYQNHRTILLEKYIP